MTEKQYRVVAVRNFPDQDPMILETQTLEEGLSILRRLTSQENFQSDQAVIRPGCRNLVFLERRSPVDGEWEFVPEEECR